MRIIQIARYQLKKSVICGKKYEVIAEYKFSYEKLGYNEAEGY